MRFAFIMALSLCMPQVAPAGPHLQSDQLDVRLLRFWDLNGSPIAVVEYALSSHDRPDRSKNDVPTATFTLRHAVDGLVARDTVWQQGFNQSRTNARDHLATGIVTFPLSPGLTSWSLTGGPSWSLSTVAASTHAEASLASDPIVVSDLAFGVPRISETWASGAQPALLDLMNVFARKDSVRLFFQVRSDAYHQNVRTWITVTNQTDPRIGRRVVQLNYPMRLEPGVNAYEHILGIAKQTPGKYVVEVQVGDLNGGGTSVQRGEFVIR